MGVNGCAPNAAWIPAKFRPLAKPARKAAALFSTTARAAPGVPWAKSKPVPSTAAPVVNLTTPGAFRSALSDNVAGTKIVEDPDAAADDRALAAAARSPGEPETRLKQYRLDARISLMQARLDDRVVRFGAGQTQRVERPLTSG